jgi:hypothetical protein
MLAQDLYSYVKNVPFRPFRIRMNSGRTFDVRHPEIIRVTRTTVLVFETLFNEELPERFEMLGVELIEDASYIDTPAVNHPSGETGG